MNQLNVVFEKPDHSMGVINEQNVSSDVFEQYIIMGKKTDNSRGVNKEKNVSSDVFEQYKY